MLCCRESSAEVDGVGQNTSEGGFGPYSRVRERLVVASCRYLSSKLPLESKAIGSDAGSV